ncbi:MAG: hypothetical protein KatS3mg010_1378 [Acidimicrobiia bacterium]|nr:MAG: hypothetical protein KatS3mg010_1378 [Acidimicrobiia bacterium]
MTHLHGEEEDGFAGDERAVERGAERERRLPLAGASGDDREGRLLEPEQQVVEVVVAGRHADDRGVAVVEVRELVHRVLEGRVQGDERVGDALLRDLEDHRLGAIDGLVDVIVALVGHLLDLSRGLDEAAQHRQLGDDLRVVGGVGRRRCRRLDAQERLPAAELLEAAGAPQLLGDGHRVDRLPATVQRERGVEDHPVRRLVEVGRLDARLHRGGERLAREHHGAEQ